MHRQYVMKHYVVPANSQQKVQCSYCPTPLWDEHASKQHYAGNRGCISRARPVQIRHVPQGFHSGGAALAMRRFKRHCWFRDALSTVKHVASPVWEHLELLDGEQSEADRVHKNENSNANKVSFRAPNTLGQRCGTMGSLFRITARSKLANGSADCDVDKNAGNCICPKTTESCYTASDDDDYVADDAPAQFEYTHFFQREHMLTDLDSGEEEYEEYEEYDDEEYEESVDEEGSFPAHRRSEARYSNFLELTDQPELCSVMGSSYPDHYPRHNRSRQNTYLSQSSCVGGANGGRDSVTQDNGVEWCRIHPIKSDEYADGQDESRNHPENPTDFGPSFADSVKESAKTEAHGDRENTPTMDRDCFTRMCCHRNYSIGEALAPLPHSSPSARTEKTDGQECPDTPLQASSKQPKECAHVHSSRTEKQRVWAKTDDPSTVKNKRTERRGTTVSIPLSVVFSKSMPVPGGSSHYCTSNGRNKRTRRFLSGAKKIVRKLSQMSGLGHCKCRVMCEGVKKYIQSLMPSRSSSSSVTVEELQYARMQQKEELQELPHTPRKSRERSFTRKCGTSDFGEKKRNSQSQSYSVKPGSGGTKNSKEPQSQQGARASDTSDGTVDSQGLSVEQKESVPTEKGTTTPECATRVRPSLLPSINGKSTTSQLQPQRDSATVSNGSKS